MENENGSLFQARPSTLQIWTEHWEIGQKVRFEITTGTERGDDVLYQQIISDDVMGNINLYINIILSGGLAIFGTLNNTANMVIFYKLGLKDSMNVYLFGLSLTDFILSAIVALSRMFPIWDTFYPDDKVDPMAIHYVAFAWYMQSLFLCSGWITTCLTLERCICVLFPFKVKRIFTRNRSIFCVVFFHVVTVVPHIPIYLSHWLTWTWVQTETNNGTILTRRLVMEFSDNRLVIETYVETTLAVVSFISVLIILVSVFLMVYSLTIYSKIRKSMTAANMDMDVIKQASQITYKTRRLISVVITLAVIYAICNIPRVFATIINIVRPDINESGKERNLASCMWQLVELFSALNASVNIFVYLNINTSYQAMFRRLFSFKRAKCK